MNCRHILEIHKVLGQRSFWANKNKALIEGALFEIGQKSEDRVQSDLSTS